MLRNYLTVALRNIIKYKAYSLINVLGLALGMAIFFLTLSLVLFELSYDRFHTKAEDIYRVHQKFNDGGTTANISYPIKQALVDDYPQIKEATSFAFMGGDRVVIDTRQVIANQIYFVEPSFFSLFDIEFVKGTRELAMQKFGTQQNDALVTEQEAKSLFGDADPVGKTFTMQSTNQSYTVLGIVKQMPRNSHFSFGVLIPILTHPQRKEVEHNWNNPVVHTYLYIPDKELAKEVNEKELDKFIAKHFPVAIGGENAHLPVIPMTDIHLHSNLYYELGQNSSVIYVTAVSSVGFLILVLAAINFMNLTTARSVRRAREVGMRKTLGAQRGALIGQFLGESIITSLLSVIVGAGLAYALLPVFNENLGQHLEIDFFSMPSLIILALISLGIGILSGLYPAFVLSAFQPITALKNNAGIAGGFFVRKGLVLFQFVVVTAMLIGILTLNRQLDYMANKDMGYDSNNLIYIRSSDKMRSDKANYYSFVEEVKNQPGIAFLAGLGNGSYETVAYEGMPPNTRKGAIAQSAGPEYSEAFGFTLLAGRFPSRSILTDNKSVVLNETAANDYGWSPIEAVGKTVALYEGDSIYTVVGVLKDFHLEPLTVRIEPTIIITTMDKHFNLTAIKLTGTRNEEAEAAIKKAWMRFDDGWGFEIWHDRDNVQSRLSDIRKLSLMMQELTSLGIFIACIGLFGLSSFSAERRTKEIGVRKVHGASVAVLWRLMVLEFANVVVAASVVGVIIGIFLVRMILENFVYRTEIGVDVYLIAVLAAIAIALATVSYQAIKSARANPVNSLRSE